MRKTKIVATIGPASSSEEVLERMLHAGLNVARFNFSHGTHEEHKILMDRFREVRDRMGVSAALMLDTKGPEIRIGIFKNGRAELNTGDTFTLTTENVEGNEKRVGISFNGLPAKVAPGNAVLIDDGKIRLAVKECSKTDIVCTVTHGGIIKDRKSVNVPNVSLGMEYISERDKSDLLFGIEEDVDFVAASFVRCADDVISLRKFINYHGGHDIKIISKIENIEGVRNFDEILENSDGIMVARGDMGVEVDFEKLPGIQKRFIKKCYQSGKMVITATQMLESMVESPMPTRAEISDVANAVFDGTSAVMLSGETAMGNDPEHVITVMSKIVTRAEQDAFELDIYRDIRFVVDTTDTTNALCDAACTTSRDMNAKAIIVVTKEGKTARKVSKFRPSEPIIASTPEVKTFHQLSLSWGVYPVLALMQDDEQRLLRHAIDCAKQINRVNDGDRVVIIAGLPLTEHTNSLKVMTV